MKSNGLVSMMVAIVAACGPAAGGPVDGSGSGEGGSGDESGDAEVDDLVRLATAMCEREVECSCEVVTPWTDLAPCVGVHHGGLLRLAEDAAAADAYAYDAECLRELADCWEQIECGESYADACASDCSVHRLNLGGGSECDPEAAYYLRPAGFVRECADDLACLSGHGYAVCDSPAPLQVGERCQDGAHHRSCAPDLYCAATDGVSECRPRIGDGGACEYSTSCALGLRCDDGTCRPKLDVGGACEHTDDCSTDLTCHPTLATCVAPAQIGEQCRFDVGGNPEFVPCIDAAWCGETSCEAPLELGSACESGDGCPEGSACEAGVCTACALGSCGHDPVCAQVPDANAYPPDE
jgi:hypothetical protein